MYKKNAAIILVVIISFVVISCGNTETQNIENNNTVVNQPTINNQKTNVNFANCWGVLNLATMQEEKVGCYGLFGPENLTAQVVSSAQGSVDFTFKTKKYPLHLLGGVYLQIKSSIDSQNPGGMTPCTSGFNVNYTVTINGQDYSGVKHEYLMGGCLPNNAYDGVIDISFLPYVEENLRNFEGNNLEVTFTWDIIGDNFDFNLEDVQSAKLWLTFWSTTGNPENNDLANRVVLTTTVIDQSEDDLLKFSYDLGNFGLEKLVSSDFKIIGELINSHGNCSSLTYEYSLGLRDDLGWDAFQSSYFLDNYYGCPEGKVLITTDMDEIPQTKTLAQFLKESEISDGKYEFDLIWSLDNPDYTWEQISQADWALWFLP